MLYKQEKKKIHVSFFSFHVAFLFIFIYIYFSAENVHI